MSENEQDVICYRAALCRLKNVATTCSGSEPHSRGSFCHDFNCTRGGGRRALCVPYSAYIKEVAAFVEGVRKAVVIGRKLPEMNAGDLERHAISAFGDPPFSRVGGDGDEVDE